ncbi:uncharacterized protein [Clytia hemisphaerica]|uniref:Uncharacterized protein n=1 Tax=Clytia hemisphaerica TaxID=252671 RepID=A0A7M5UN17_9CNID
MEQYNQYTHLGRGNGRGRGKRIMEFLKNIQIKEKEKIGRRSFNRAPGSPVREQFQDVAAYQNLQKANAWKAKLDMESQCICDESVEKLICGNCNGILNKRPQIVCKVHRIIHLMDYKNCPHCKVEL